MSINLPNGIAELLGDTLVTSSPLFTSNRLWYVNSETGVDDAAYGDSKAKPYATLAYALGAGAVDGDIIVLADGHEEVITVTVDIIIEVIIVGCGQTDGKPTVRFTKDISADYLFDIQADNVELRNIWFEENEQNSAVNQVQVSGTGCRLIGCYFEANQTHNSQSVVLANSLITTIKDCTFVANGATIADLPTGALLMGTGTLFMDNCIFDDNEFGYESFAFRSTGAAVIRGEGNSFLNGAQVSLTESGDIILAGGTTSGGVQLIEE